MGTDILGGFEHHVLLAMMQIGESAYSVPIVVELEERTGRTVSASAVYITLRRLERRGLVSSVMEPPPGEESGKPRRVFRLEPAGLDQLRESKQSFARLWHGLAALDEG
jgi:DNA-binding PadR family transcriptional regulator